MSGQLYTIPFSHYCELARWSLQEAKVAYVEHPYLPGIHRIFGPMQRLRAASGSTGSGPSGGQGTPLFVAADGKIVDDSWSVLELCMGPVEEEMKTVLNQEIGPQVRAIVYSDLLKPEKDEAFKALGKDSPVSWWQRFMWGLSGFRHKVSSLMKKDIVGNEERQAKTLQDFEVAIQKVEAELAKPDGCFKGAPESLTSHGLALAALFAPAVLPVEYSGKFAPDIKLEIFSEEMQQRIQKWRERPIGKFTLQMYSQHRMRCVP